MDINVVSLHRLALVYDVRSSHDFGACRNLVKQGNITRFTLGRSCEINCPTIPLQLAGSKKIQKALICPDMVERIMYDSEADAVKNTSSEELRKTWMPTWPRHGQDVPWFQHPRETTPARTLATSLVLKLGVMCSNLISCLSWTAYLLTVSDMFGSQWS